jgi:DME family drug/metabolite transporter
MEQAVSDKNTCLFLLQVRGGLENDRGVELKVRGYLYIITAALLWGILAPFSRLALSEGIAPLEVAFWRAILAWGFFAVHAAITKSVRMRVSDLPLVVLFAITGVSLFYGSYQMGVRSGGAALTVVLMYTAPAWVTVIARFAFRERMTPFKSAALVLTLAGVALVALGGGTIQITPKAILFGLSAGFFYSLYYIFGKHFAPRYSSPNLFLYLLPIGAMTIAPWVEFSSKSPVVWGALICIAALCTYGAYFFYYQGLLYLEASRAATVATLEPVAAAVVAYIWWGEAFGASGYLGALLVLAAVLMMVWDPRYK